jgi:muramoyltetrapeptide carboxypeptidase
VTLFIDPPNAAGHGRMWSHLASDTSYDELHAFAATLGVPERGFDGDHYDVPAEWYDRVVAAGVVPVSSRELIDRLTRAGLRVRKSSRLRPRKPGRALLAPPAVVRGSAVGVVSVAGVPEPVRLAAGMDVLREWGLTVVGPDSGGGEFDWLAGPDRERAEAFTRVWLDPAIDVVWCARGGFGTQRILDLLDWRLLATARPKWLVGFSDVTALHQAVASRLGVVTLHGPGVTGLDDPVAAGSAWEQLTAGPNDTSTLVGRPGVSGTAQGVLVGGNLTMLASSVGTRFTHPAADSIVVLEDVGERPYRLDRALTQLLRSGWFAGARGVVCGQFTDSGDPKVIEALLLARLGTLGVPLLLDAPLGHSRPNLAFPLGRVASLDAGAGRLSW